MFAAISLASILLMATPPTHAVVHEMPRNTALRTVLRGPGSVVMELSRNQPVIEARINGRGPFRLVLDTGAGPPLLLNQSIAEQIGLRRISATSVGDPSNSARVPGSISQVDSIQVGTATFHDLVCIYLPRSIPTTDANAPVGVIGVSLFSELLLTFDYPGRRVTFERGALSAPDGVRTISYQSSHGIPEIIVEVDGHRLQAHLDTGSSGMLGLPSRFQDSLHLASKPVEVGRARTINNELVFYGAPLAGDFKFGGRTYHQPMVTFNDVLPRVNVGSRLLKDFTMTIDQKQRRIRFIPDTTAAAAAPAPTRRYGVMFSPEGPFEIRGVMPGSPAERGGLQVGDLVVALDGRPAAEMNEDARTAAMRRSPLRLTIRRGERQFDVTLAL